MSKLSPGDRVRHRREKWEGTIQSGLIVGMTLTGENLYKWLVATDEGERACDGSELILCNTRQGGSALSLHKNNATTPILCNKQMGEPTQLLHKIMTDLGSLPLAQLQELQQYVTSIIANLTTDDIPLKKGRELVERVVSGGNVYQLEKVKCGKANCKCCPHGPYWYAYFRRGGKLVSKYVGKELKAVLSN